MGAIEAILRLGGIVPETMEELIISVMVGLRVGRQASTKAVGMGSRGQDEALAFETSLVTSALSTGETAEREQCGEGKHRECAAP